MLAWPWDFLDMLKWYWGAWHIINKIHLMVYLKPQQKRRLPRKAIKSCISMSWAVLLYLRWARQRFVIDINKLAIIFFIPCITNIWLTSCKTIPNASFFPLPSFCKFRKVQNIKEKKGILTAIVIHTNVWYGHIIAVNLDNGPGFFEMNPSLLKKYG